MGDSQGNEETLSQDEVQSLLSTPEKNTLAGYKDVHTIGLGGFGAVYAATEPGLKRKLALKILRPRYRNQKERIYSFIREARITAQIAHPNIVPVHRIGVFEDAGPYFSMKRVAGETLRAILKKLDENRPGYRKKYPLPRLLDIFMGACQGVYYAHQNGICHCDLKPENIMVGNFGEVLVMDWGMARYLPGYSAADTEPAVEASPQKSQMGGTPVFMAPEHLSLSSNEATVKSDIYALGCVLYSILTWKTSPFEGAETLEEIQKKVVQEKLPLPRHCVSSVQPVPREVEAVCLKAMSRLPENRYDTVNDLLEDLRNYRDGLPVMAYSPSPVYKFGKFIFRHPLIPVVLFLSLLTWCIFSMYTFFHEKVQIESLRHSAVKNFRDGEKRLLQARKKVLQLHRGSLDATDMQTLESSVAADAADAEADYKTTLDIIERIPVAYRNRQLVNETAKKIFLSYAAFCNLTRNDEKLYNFTILCDKKWRNIFAPLRKTDPRFDSQFSHALSGTGTILLENTANVKWRVEDNSGRMLSLEKSKNADTEKIELPVGLYTVTAETSDGRVKRVPVRSSLSVQHKADLSIPPIIPKGMVFIPGGEFNHFPDISNGFRRNSFEDDFLIKETEVTVAEYLEFWNSLEDRDLKKLYASYYFDHNGSLLSLRSWDDTGKILRKGLLPNHPVTGISGFAADAFCAWLSKKLNRPILLPSRAQWIKAAGGIDGTEYTWGNEYIEDMAVISKPAFQVVGSMPKDCSIYGVFDLSGNVREFVKVSARNGGLQGKYAIAGGSYHSLPAVARLSNIVYSSRGGNDVGFRYVMPVEKKKISQFEKK